MLHGISYPDETGSNEREVRLWKAKMQHGVIQFIRPDECTLVRKVGEGTAKIFDAGNMQSVDDLYSEWFGNEVSE
ncbi:CRISPR-associated protein [Paenibacillus pini JCM 16418]|uniref:CRISPR-associated protein n=2 Tax=Paenibacillus TaxID=44249 RepID=W7YX11_9BACL|nr:CRISPR-associated protein [Paenibacillus pini JCM 16418]